MLTYNTNTTNNITNAFFSLLQKCVFLAVILIARRLGPQRRVFIQFFDRLNKKNSIQFLLDSMYTHILIALKWSILCFVSSQKERGKKMLSQNVAMLKRLLYKSIEVEGWLKGVVYNIRLYDESETR